MTAAFPASPDHPSSIRVLWSGAPADAPTAYAMQVAVEEDLRTLVRLTDGRKITASFVKQDLSEAELVVTLKDPAPAE